MSYLRVAVECIVAVSLVHRARGMMRQLYEEWEEVLEWRGVTNKLQVTSATHERSDCFYFVNVWYSKYNVNKYYNILNMVVSIFTVLKVQGLHGQ